MPSAVAGLPDISQDEFPWIHLLACPDCQSSLVRLAEGGVGCPACGRTFARSEGGYFLMPSGREPTKTSTPQQAIMYSNGLFRWVLRYYSSAGKSPAVSRLLDRLLRELKEDEWAVNIGSRDPHPHPRLLKLDVCDSPFVHLLGAAERLPLRDNTIACAFSRDVFEHLPNPWVAAREVARVLKPGGTFLISVPFFIGYHPAPGDYWRFTHQGLCAMLKEVGLEVMQVQAASGAGTTLYRIGVEAAATMAGLIWSRLYLPAKAVAALGCAPLRWLDPLVSSYGPTNRIVAGFYALARKP